MSLSCSDCFSDFLCEENSSTIFSSGGDGLPECSSDIESRPPDFDDFIAGLLEDERDLAAITPRSSHESMDASARAQSVAWIFKAQRYHGFQPLTAYLSVNYFDRFLCSHHLLEIKGWTLQLLSVACLSLAAKMEEPLVPSLLDLQVEGAKFIFEPKNITRMELLVLRVLDWRLKSIVPFCYLVYFALKIDPAGTYTGFLTSRAKDIILSIIQETSFIEHKPSCIAAAAILCAANDLPKLFFITAPNVDSGSDGLHKEDILKCYQLIRKIETRNSSKKQTKVLPKLRVTTLPSPTSTSSSSSSSSSYYIKRRKLNNYSPPYDDKTN